jgi:hypothetical protein
MHFCEKVSEPGVRCAFNISSVSAGGPSIAVTEQIQFIGFGLARLAIMQVPFHQGFNTILECFYFIISH